MVQSSQTNVIAEGGAAHPNHDRSQDRRQQPTGKGKGPLRMPRQKGPWRLLTKCYYHTALAQPSEKMEEVRTIIDHLYYLVFRRLVTALCRVEAVCERFG